MVMNILITGSKGFVGRNLVVALRRREGLNLFEYDLGSHAALLDEALQRADVIFHRAGVNRPQAGKIFILEIRGPRKGFAGS